MRFFCYLSLLILTIIFTGCEENDSNQPVSSWNYLGLGKYSVQEIKVSNDVLLAATRNGMFTKSLNTNDTLWQRAGLEGMEITDFIVDNTDEWLAGTNVSNNQSNVFYKTTNGGVTWEPLQSNFGGAEGTQTCYALEKAPEQEGILYARGIINVAKSTDGGNTWNSVYQNWNNTGYQADLILADPQNPNIVWAGGENSIFSPYLIKSTNGGESWSSQDIPSGGDNAVYSMVIHPDNSDRVMVGMEAQIIHTSDGGENWEVNFSPSESSYVLDIQHSMVKTERVYATGTDGGTSLGDIILFISDDFGQRWETVKHEGRAGFEYGAQDMAIHVNQDTEGVYVGTNQGVFVYQPDL